MLGLGWGGAGRWLRAGEQEESRVCGWGGLGASTMPWAAAWEAAHLSSSAVGRGAMCGELLYGQWDHMPFNRTAARLCLLFAGIAGETTHRVCSDVFSPLSGFLLQGSAVAEGPREGVPPRGGGGDAGWEQDGPRRAAGGDTPGNPDCVVLFPEGRRE